MTSAQPAVLPFLVPSIPEPVVHNIFALAPDSTAPDQLKIFNLPPLSTISHISHAFQTALAADEPVLSSVELHGKNSDSLLQVEGVHATRSTSKVTPLFVHPLGSAVTEQQSQAFSATLHCVSTAAAFKILKGWPAAPKSKLPQWPFNQILSYHDLQRLSRPDPALAQKHADQWIDRFEAGPEPDQHAVYPSTLSKRAKKRLAAEESEAAQKAKKAARKEAKAVEADGGEWTVVKKGGRIEKPVGMISTQTDQEQQQSQVSAGGKQRKGLMVDNMGNATEHQGKKGQSKFMPAAFYRSKKDDQRKKVLNDLQSKFEQDKAKAAGLKRAERRFKPY